MVTDGTYTLEFMIFEKRGTELIGKNAETLRKLYDITQTPPEITSLIGHKFTFIVKVLSKSINALEPSFEVVLMKEKFGKQPVPATSQLYQSSTLASNSTMFAEHEDLPLLLPITSKKYSRPGKIRKHYSQYF
jgi:replication factor A1